MDDVTPEIPVAGEPEPTEYDWLKPPAEPAAGASEAWSAAPAQPVESTWTIAEPALEAEPETTARPAWTPAVWEPAPAAAPPVEEAPAADEPEAEPVVEDEPAEKTPFLKKEISFRRKPKAAPAEPAEKTSLLKKEISFRRKPKAAPAATVEPGEKTSLLKKEISFKRKPKTAKAEVAPKPEKAAKRSFLKAEISLKRKPKADKPAKAVKPKPEAAEKTSFLKKDLSLGRKRSAQPKAPKAAKPARPRKPARTKPAVASKKLVGLKIGASQLAAARVVNGGTAELTQVARASLPQGVVVGGEVRDIDGLAGALKAFFAKNKLPKRGVRLGIASNRIGVRVFELDGIDDPRQLANAVRFRAQEALPIPLDEAVLDYRILEERVDENGRTVRRVLLVVAYRELIDRYVAACRNAGIQLVGIDLEAFALLRALPAPAEEGAAAAALVAVSIGSDRSTFAVSDGRTTEFTRVLEWGGHSLDVAVARALDLSPSEAEPIKRAIGLEGGQAPEGLTQDRADAARDAIRREVQTFARELVSSLQFYQNQPGSLSIAEIVVTGGTAHLSGIADQLQRLIGVRVQLGDPLEHVRVAKRLRGDEQIGSLTIAIGLGLESATSSVNLLPKDAGRSQRKPLKPAAVVALAGGALVVVGAGALYLTSSGTLSSRQAELASRQAELASIPRPALPQPAPAEGSELAGLRAPRVAAVSSALAERVSWDRLLRRFSLVLPNDVWLQSMTLTSPNTVAPVDAATAPAGADGAVASGPQGFTITGRTYSHAGVARLLARLAAVPDLQDVQLQTSHRVADAAQDLVEFTIVASVRGDGASE